MRMALDQANQAFTQLDEVPVGAILVQHGYVVASGFNRREVDRDPTAHAEMMAIREASAETWQLAIDRYHTLCHPGTLPHVCRGHSPGSSVQIGIWSV